MSLSSSVMKTYGRIDIAFTHGKGSFLFDYNGKYLDYAKTLLSILLDTLIQIN